MLIRSNYRRFKPKPLSRLQRFSGSIKKPLKLNKDCSAKECHKTGYFKYLKEVLFNFLGTFTAHGFDRIIKSSLCSIKGFIWLLGFSLCVAILVYVSHQLASKYHDKPLITVISDTQLPVYKIPFPEVTICNQNHLNWQRYEQAREMFLKPQHFKKRKYETVFENVLTAYDTLTSGKFYKFNNLTKVPISLLNELNYVNFSLVLEFMSWKCHEMLTDCYWLNEPYNCCDIFLQRYSQMGLCLGFNTIESPEGREKQKLDPYWPWRSMDLDSQNGLKVQVHLREYQQSSSLRKGRILVMLAEPGVWYDPPIYVDTHSMTSITLSPVLHFFDNYTRFFSPPKRQCVFEDEYNSIYYKTLQNHPYMLENCQSECQQEYMMKYCNCTFKIFYPPSRYPPCQLSDYPCLVKYNEKFLYFEQIGETDYVTENLNDVMKCNCYRNCKSLDYLPDVHSANFADGSLDNDNSFVNLAVFYKQDSIVVYRTTVRYTLIDLMAGFGGLAGLCIGCSLVSLVEVIYFLVIDIPYKSVIYFMKRKKLLLQRKIFNIRMNVIDRELGNK